MPNEFARHLRKNLTDTERFAWYQLRKRQFAGFKFRRQHPIGPFIVDFVCLEAKLILEFDGGQHAVLKAADAARTRLLEAQGYRVVRFWNIDVLKEWDGVAEAILRHLAPDQCPRRTGEKENGGRGGDARA